MKKKKDPSASYASALSFKNTIEVSDLIFSMTAGKFKESMSLTAMVGINLMIGEISLIANSQMTDGEKVNAVKDISRGIGLIKDGWMEAMVTMVESDMPEVYAALLKEAKVEKVDEAKTRRRTRKRHAQ